LTLGNIDEDVDYDQALAAGRTTAVALTAMSGVVIGNGAFYLIARQLLRRPAVAARPWVLYFLFWYIVHSVGNFYDYVPLRTFAANGDVKNFALGSGWSLWWILGTQDTAARAGHPALGVGSAGCAVISRCESGGCAKRW
jgi:hypothetical protein